MRILCVHPRLDTLPGYYGPRGIVEQLNVLAPAATPVVADITSTPDWATMAAQYDVLHLPLSQLDYEPELPGLIREVRALGMQVLISLDVPLSGRSRLAQLRRQVCQAAGNVLVTSYSLRNQVETEVGFQVRVQVLDAYVPVVKPVNRLPKSATSLRVGVYPVYETKALEFLRDTAAYLKGMNASVDWLVLGGPGGPLDQQGVNVVPNPELSRSLRALGTAGMKVALRCFNQNNESLSGLMRAFPPTVELPRSPFLALRQPMEPTPAQRTQAALLTVSAQTMAKVTPLLQLRQLAEVDVILFPPKIAGQEQTNQLLAGIAAQLGTQVLGEAEFPVADARSAAKWLARWNNERTQIPQTDVRVSPTAAAEYAAASLQVYTKLTA